KLLAKGHQIARAHGVVAHGDDARIAPREREELLGEGLPAVVRLAHEPVSRSSSSAAATCGAVGTLWCHSTRFSMKETPFPFTVSAMTVSGLPLRPPIPRRKACSRST